jgi:hypothetical protein
MIVCFYFYFFCVGPMGVAAIICWFTIDGFIKITIIMWLAFAIDVLNVLKIALDTSYVLAHKI